MDELPPELEGFASLLDAQPQPTREAFQYCLCLYHQRYNSLQIQDEELTETG